MPVQGKRNYALSVFCFGGQGTGNLRLCVIGKEPRNSNRRDMRQLQIASAWRFYEAVKRPRPDISGKPRGFNSSAIYQGIS
jgi:hypothetical protein